MKYIGTVLVISFLLAFLAINLVIGFTTELYWANLIYLGLVLTSIGVSRWFVYHGVSLAVFPYSSYFIGLSHQQDINR